MTDEDRDRLEGRVNRELRDADKALNELLAKATHLATDITSLAAEITNRVDRARQAGTTWTDGSNQRQHTQQDAGIEFGRLKRYEKVVDLEAIDALDREIGKAVAKLLTAQQEKARLGV